MLRQVRFLKVKLYNILMLYLEILYNLLLHRRHHNYHRHRHHQRLPYNLLGLMDLNLLIHRKFLVL
tara:strand:+ start:646 stop:843 length:198 start_codon:yes stop_codon:yes gene_type:complete